MDSFRSLRAAGLHLVETTPRRALPSGTERGNRKEEREKMVPLINTNILKNKKVPFHFLITTMSIYRYLFSKKTFDKSNPFRG